MIKTRTECDARIGERVVVCGIAERTKLSCFIRLNDAGIIIEGIEWPDAALGQLVVVTADVEWAPPTPIPQVIEPELPEASNLVPGAVVPGHCQLVVVRWHLLLSTQR